MDVTEKSKRNPKPESSLDWNTQSSDSGRERKCSHRAAKATRTFVVMAITWSAAYAYFSSTPNTVLQSMSRLWKSEESVWGPSNACIPPSPNIFAYSPPRPSNEIIVKASQSLDNWLSKRVSKDDIDSLAISVVTVAGPIFEAGYGVLKANESETGAEGLNPVDRNSIYRIASVSKMFTVLETLILRERGALNWDDPVEKFLPDFSPPGYGWSSYLNGVRDSDQRERITLRQAASHLAGIGRDYPPIDIGEWPNTEPGGVMKSVVPGYEERKYEDIMKAVAEYPLVNIPDNYPIYSNTGIDMLGLANIAANKLASSKPDNEPQAHKELVKRDIFDPLGMNSSFYRTPGSPLREHIAVPSKFSEWADISLGDADDPAGGQYSSLGDLAKLMQTLLSPTARGGVIPARVVREWLRPLYVWGTSQHQVGAPWEIMDLANVRAYTKGGNIPGYHSEFALIPEYSYGIVLLVTGEYADTRTLLLEAAKHFQSAISKLYQIELQRRYVGTWTNGEDVAEVSLDKGKNALYLKKLVIRDIDVLKFVQSLDPGLNWGHPAPVALWSTGRAGEFRLAFGRPQLNNVPGVGCMPYWITIDPGLFSRGAPIDLLYWDKGVLTYPSAGVSFSRK